MAKLAEKRRVWQSLSVITLVALGLRLVFVGFLYRHTWNDFGDHLLFGFETGRIARSIASGHGYGNPFSAETGPTAYMTPLYPYLLAVVFKLFGIYSRTSAIIILCLNGVFSALVCVPLYFTAQHSFGRGVAVVSCWMWALLPYSIYIASSFVWETCLSALLLVILFFWTLRLRERPGDHWQWLGFGALWGLGALSNPSLLSVFPFLAAWALYPLWRNGRACLTAALLAALGAGAILLPWQVRNYRTLHAFVPLRDSFWLAVWVGNDGYTAGLADLSAHPSTSKPALDEFVRLGEIRYMQEKRRQSLDFISGHPGFFVVMCLRRFAYMWTRFWNDDPSNLALELHDPSNLFFTVPLTLLMLLGLWQAFRSFRQAAVPYLLVLGIYPLAFYLTLPEIRYRHLIDPQILILAALGVMFLARELVKGFPSLEIWLQKYK